MVARRVSWAQARGMLREPARHLRRLRRPVHPPCSQLPLLALRLPRSRCSVTWARLRLLGPLRPTLRSLPPHSLGSPRRQPVSPPVATCSEEVRNPVASLVVVRLPLRPLNLPPATPAPVYLTMLHRPRNLRAACLPEAQVALHPAPSSVADRRPPNLPTQHLRLALLRSLAQNPLRRLRLQLPARPRPRHPQVVIYSEDSVALPQPAPLRRPQSLHLCSQPPHRRQRLHLLQHLLRRRLKILSLPRPLQLRLPHHPPRLPRLSSG